MKNLSILLLLVLLVSCTKQNLIEPETAEITYFTSLEELKTLDGVYADEVLLREVEMEARKRAGIQQVGMRSSIPWWCGTQSDWEHTEENPNWRDLIIVPDTTGGAFALNAKGYQNIWYFPFWDVALVRDLHNNNLAVIEWPQDWSGENLKTYVLEPAADAEGLPMLLRTVSSYDDLYWQEILQVQITRPWVATNTATADWMDVAVQSSDVFAFGSQQWEVDADGSWTHSSGVGSSSGGGYHAWYKPIKGHGLNLHGGGGFGASRNTLWLVPLCGAPEPPAICQGVTPSTEQIEAFEQAAIHSATLHEGYSGFPRELYHEDIESWSYLGNLVQILEICGEKHPAIFTFDKDTDGVKTNHRIRVLGRDGSTTDYPLAGDGEIVSIGLDGQDNFFDVPLCGLPCVDTITSYRWFEVDTEDSYESAEWRALVSASGKDGQCSWSGIWEGTDMYLHGGVSRRFKVIGEDVDLIGRMIMNPFDYNENYIANMPDDDGTLTEDTERTIDIVDHPLYTPGIQRIQLNDGEYFYPAVAGKNVTQITALPELDDFSYNSCP